MASDLTQEPWANDPSPVQKRLCDPRLPRGHSDILALAFASPEVLWTVEEGGRFSVWNASQWGICGDSSSKTSNSASTPGSLSRGKGPRSINLDDPGMLWVLEPDWNMGFSASGELAAYELPSGEPLWTRECKSWITAIATGPGTIPGRPGIVLTGHDDGSIFLWDLSGPKRSIKRISLDLIGPVAALAISPDGSKFAVASTDRTIAVFDRKGSAEILSTPSQASGHKGPITSLCWGGDNGKTLFSASWDQTVRVWDVNEAKPLILLNSHMGHVTAMAWTGSSGPDAHSGIHFVSADDSGHLHAWDTGNWSLYGGPRELDDPVRILAISPNGRLVAWADSARHIHLVPLAELAEDTNTLFPDTMDPRSIRDDLFLDPQSRQLLHRGVNGQVRFWQIQGGVEESGPTPASSAIVCGSDGNRIWLAEAGGPPENPLAASGVGPETNSRRGGRILGFHRTIGSQWRLESVFETSFGDISSLALSDDGGLLAIGSHLGPGVEIRSLPGGVPVALWGCDWPGETVQAITPTEGGWVVGTLDPMSTGGTPGHTWFVGPEGARRLDRIPARVLARHAPSESVARIDHHGHLAVYRDGGFVGLPEISGPWQAIAFSPDGRHLVLGGERKISLYDLKRDKWIGSVETVSVVRAIIMDGGPSAIWATFRCGECCLLSMENWIDPEGVGFRGLMP